MLKLSHILLSSIGIGDIGCIFSDLSDLLDLLTLDASFLSILLPTPP